MDVQSVYNNVICFPLELGAMVASLIIIAASFGLAVWGMVNGAPVTIIFFLISMTVWNSYLYGLHQKKLNFMLPALYGGAIKLFGLYIGLTVVCFSAFLTENKITLLPSELLSKKEHFLTLFIGIIILVFLAYFCYIAFCAYEKLRMQQQELKNISHQTQGMDIEQPNETHGQNTQSHDS